ncbi:glycosyltransferase [Alkalihalobacillus sp. CinArs1]|uniref:glycosyltransferase n=1 Tax=Alkalihalobacillus sp. CinArs1 TaxID=2995314 RepID=UPI0022DE7D72|nr:glycosyltransferase [Alkalihalobacillus sp. CinArs1]
MTRVLVVPSGYPEELIPYRGIFYKRQAESLHGDDLEITVAYPEIWSIKTFGKQKDNSGLTVNKENGIVTYRMKGYNYFANLPYTTEGIFYNRLKKLYNKLVSEQGKPTVIHAHSCLWAGYAAAKISKEENIPLVITEHSSVFGRGLLKPYQKRLVKDALDQANEIIAVGPRLRNELAEYTTKPIHLIPNAVDPSFFQVPDKVPNEPFRFISVANLNRNKGMDVLIDAFEKKFKGTAAELKIGGDGPVRGELEALVKEKGLSNQIEFLGALDKEQVKSALEEAHVFVLASRYETFGVVLVEAMAAGKPLIATKCGGPEAIVSDKTGVLVPVDDSNALGTAMSNMEKQYEEYHPDTIRLECKERFSETAVNQHLQQIYQNVTKNTEKIVK